MEQALPRAHFLEKHGAQTTLDAQLERVMTAKIQLQEKSKDTLMEEESANQKYLAQLPDTSATGTN
ncbi:hypothetical protein JTY93_23690 [Pseudomonas hygromyciniae]|uniref:Uncharacterized protein n=1 Tax=Pseudomonas hygromyciniae TaxID=2812000 RepID=A0ABX7JXC5_9PSED|nr:hypothetical protein JTY93_23690 [Pseudomonas hygromyciniae]